MSDDSYHDELFVACFDNDRDRYIQALIDYLDDPDYDGIPILVDDKSYYVWDRTAENAFALLFKTFHELLNEFLYGGDKDER